MTRMSSAKGRPGGGKTSKKRGTGPGNNHHEASRTKMETSGLPVKPVTELVCLKERRPLF